MDNLPEEQTQWALVFDSPVWAVKNSAHWVCSSGKWTTDGLQMDGQMDDGTSQKLS